MRISSTSDPTAAKTGVTNTFTEPQIISVTLPDFPRVTLLDDFNRPGSGLGTNWSPSAVYTAGTLALIGSGIVELQADQSAAMYWNSAYFGPDFDVVVEIADGLQADYAEVDILFRSANLEVTPRSNGGVYYCGGPDYWGCGIWNYPDGVYTNLVDLDILSAPVNPALGARVYGNTVELWIRDDGVWTKMSTQTLTMDLTTSFRIAVGFYDTLGSSIKVTSFSAQDLPDILTFESDSSPVARISAGGIVVPSVSTASAGDSFSVGDQHTFTAKQTFDPSNSDPAIEAVGPVNITGKTTITRAAETDEALDVTGQQVLRGKLAITPTFTTMDGGAKRGLQITPNYSLTTGNDGGEATAAYYEAILSSSSTKAPSWLRAHFAAATNDSTTAVPSEVTGVYGWGKTSANADATNVNGIYGAAGAGEGSQINEINSARFETTVSSGAVVAGNSRGIQSSLSLIGNSQAVRGLDISVTTSAGSVSSDMNGIRINPISASNGTHSTLVGLYLGAITGASANYAIYSAGGQVFFHTAAADGKGLVVQGSASQTANLQEWQDSSGTVLAYIDSAGNLVQSVQALTDASTVDWNLKLGGYASLTIGGNRTLANPTNMVAGGSYTLKITQDGAGNRTLGFGSAYKWVGGTPTLSTAAGSIDIISFVSDGTYMYGSILKGFA